MILNNHVFGVGFQASELHSSVAHRRKCQATLVVHVSGFLSAGLPKGLLWVYEELKKTYDLKKHLLEWCNNEVGQAAQPSAVRCVCVCE